MQIHLAPLAADVTEQELKELFAPFSEVESVFIEPGADANNQSAIVKLPVNPSTATIIADKLDGRLFKGRALRVRPLVLFQDQATDNT